MSLTLIATTTLTGSASSVSFSSIASSFTDLLLVLNARTDRANYNSDLYLQFNSTNTATYSFRRLYGDGSGTGSDALTNNAKGGFIGPGAGNSATSNTFSNVAIYIPNYAGSTAKSWSADGVGENNATSSFQQITAGLWSGTSAITSIQLYDYNSANFVSGTTASLYGITKGSGGATVSP